ncbi:XdhC/CoxI family protein [Halorubrum sp. CBA1125]|uniref:XdhC family protein n=1 Tax=Halorubrum sp. CBA1125 TaxID=2668072 RepID=UPI0012E88012|nr:XdhC/CoxI family protein [Halorubrum sp. CBA1125]MUW15093.1 XdhC/CoxI family protein [Halorubrum sp. CBA1125]
MTAGDWSVPETEVMDAIAEGLDERNAVLATVVAVEGSAYRRPGAKMVVVDDGDGVGSITAGCLEDEVLKLATQVLDDGEPRVRQFDLTGDDDVWGLGVGCNGVIDILLEPLDDRYRPVVDAYQRGEDTAVLTVLTSDDSRLDLGDRALGFSTATSNEPDLRFETTAWPEWILDEISPTAELLVGRDKSDSVTAERDDETVEVFVDSVTAPPELIVFGSGHDVAPVASLAKRVDFRVTVASFRGAAAEEDRFPAADSVLSTSPAAVRETLSFDENTYAVVMTHNFVDDTIVLKELLETPIEYIGLMGPRKRFEEMQTEFNDEGRTFTESELERIYTPAGLDLGGGTPFHIAQSIVAEVTAVHHDRDPTHLKEREGTIHRRVEIDS